MNLDHILKIFNNKNGIWHSFPPNSLQKKRIRQTGKLLYLYSSVRHWNDIFPETEVIDQHLGQ